MTTPFARTLRHLRETRTSMSQMRLAAVMGIDHSSVSRWESGERNPTVESVTAIADALTLSNDDRARLLTAAGYDPLVADLSDTLADDRLPAATRDELRRAVSAALGLVGMGRAA